MLVDNNTELSKIDIVDPTTDGKLAFLRNTLVPRRLDKFDDLPDVLTELERGDILMYGAQVHDDFGYCVKSYKISLKKLQDLYSIIREVNDQNFVIDNYKLDLSLTNTYGKSLVDFYNETQDQVADLENKKQDKFLVYGSGDKIEDGKVVPVYVLDSEGKFLFDDGVHVEYDSEGNSRIYHTEVVGFDNLGNPGWTSKYACGGVGVGRYFTADTPIKEVVRLMLYGDPQYDSVAYFGATKTPAAITELELALWQHIAVTYQTEFDITSPYIVIDDNLGMAIALPGPMWDSTDPGFHGTTGKWLDLEYSTDVDDPLKIEYSRKEHWDTCKIEGAGNFRLWYMKEKQWPGRPVSWKFHFAEVDTKPTDF